MIMTEFVTRVPTETERAMSVNTFREKPAQSASRKVETSVTGMDTAIIIVILKLCRNKYRTRAVRIIPRYMVDIVSLTLSLINTEVSSTTTSEEFAGSWFSSIFTSFRMPPATFTVLASDCLKTDSFITFLF